MFSRMTLGMEQETSTKAKQAKSIQWLQQQLVNKQQECNSEVWSTEEVTYGV